ncbi:hypothetical protein BDQ17DRAFT_1347563 [Cyathus striatus]|nr:hypothetical protein BDQ17DRAFT_1347563 [Cyathus striatus]
MSKCPGVRCSPLIKLHVLETSALPRLDNANPTFSDSLYLVPCSNTSLPICSSYPPFVKGARSPSFPEH